jgi:hypothetical protein
MDSGTDTGIGWVFHIPLARKEKGICPFKPALVTNYFLRAKNHTSKEIDFNVHLALNQAKKPQFN